MTSNRIGQVFKRESAPAVDFAGELPGVEQAHATPTATQSQPQLAHEQCFAVQKSG